MQPAVIAPPDSVSRADTLPSRWPVRPDLVRTLTLISPAMPFLDPRRSAHGRMIPLLWVPRVDRLAQRRLHAIEPADLARQVLELCFADPTRIHEQRMVEAIEETRL